MIRFVRQVTGAPIRFAGAIFWVRFLSRGAAITPLYKSQEAEPLRRSSLHLNWQLRHQLQLGYPECSNSIFFNGLPQ
jgi:hypothetical protein